MFSQLALAAAFGVAAFLFSIVGHGGASAYIAIGTLGGIAPAQLRPIALMLGVSVASVSWWKFREHFVWRNFIPLAAASVPAAYFGAQLKISTQLLSLLLASLLAWSGAKLIIERPTTIAKWAAFSGANANTRHFVIAPICGASIGFLSGVLGIGGAILLGPLLLTLRWSDVKQTSAMSAAFSVANSVSGLVANAMGGTLAPVAALPYLGGAIVGASVGAYVGAKKFSSRALSVTLGTVLVAAAAKLAANALKG